MLHGKWKQKPHTTTVTCKLMGFRFLFHNPEYGIRNTEFFGGNSINFNFRLCVLNKIFALISVLLNPRALCIFYVWLLWARTSLFADAHAGLSIKTWKTWGELDVLVSPKRESLICQHLLFSPLIYFPLGSDVFLDILKS